MNEKESKKECLDNSLKMQRRNRVENDKEERQQTSFNMVKGAPKVLLSFLPTGFGVIFALASR